MSETLVVSPSWIGDAVLSHPLLARLKARDPGGAIDVLAPAWASAVYDRMPEVRRTIAFPFGHGELRIGERRRFARMPIGLNNAGILNVMKALADAEAHNNILVTTVCPGPILTERQTRLLQDAAKAKGITVEAAQREVTGAIPLKRMGRPEEVADVVAFLASERASYITGSLVIVDGGLYRAMI